jgi:hypothetical protein
MINIVFRMNRYKHKKKDCLPAFLPGKLTSINGGGGEDNCVLISHQADNRSIPSRIFRSFFYSSTTLKKTSPFTAWVVNCVHAHQTGSRVTSCKESCSAARLSVITDTPAVHSNSLSLFDFDTHLFFQRTSKNLRRVPLNRKQTQNGFLANPSAQVCIISIH